MYRVEFSADAERDFEIIFDFLADSYISFGDDVESALTPAEMRIENIRQSAESLARTPRLGTRHDELLDGLRHVTIERAVFWFDVDEAKETIRVLAIFFGGQDHQRRMLIRLLE